MNANVRSSVRSKARATARQDRSRAGNPDLWRDDVSAKIVQPLGLEVVLAFDGADASLVRLASRATDGDYVAFARRAVLDAARAISGLVPPDWVSQPPTLPGGKTSENAYRVAQRGLRISEAAALYGVKHDRLQRAAKDGRLPARKLGDGDRDPWEVDAVDVERFLATSRRGPKRRWAA